MLSNIDEINGFYVARGLFGQALSFYLTAIDEQLCDKNDNKTVGLLLCKKKNKVVAEYALRGINKPIGVSEYQLTKAIPDNLKTDLPSIEELESELSEE